jgi:hypothetical protein
MWTINSAILGFAARQNASTWNHDTCPFANASHRVGYSSITRRDTVTLRFASFVGVRVSLAIHAPVRIPSDSSVKQRASRTA